MKCHIISTSDPFSSVKQNHFSIANVNNFARGGGMKKIGPFTTTIHLHI